MNDKPTVRRPGRLYNQEPSGKLPLLAKLKVGEKRMIRNKDGKEVEIPSSIDYFKASGKYADTFHEVLGDKPTKVGIMFISDDIASSCYERFECRDKTGALVGDGDGRFFKVWDAAKGRMVDFEIKTEKDHEIIKAMGEWKQCLGIKFVIPAIKTVMGLWAFETSGKASSIPNIRDTYDNVLEMAGTVINIPFDLTVEKVVSQKPGVKRTFPVVSLVPNLGKDRLEDIHGFLQAGNSVRDIKSLIEGNIDTTKHLGSGEPIKVEVKEETKESKPIKVIGEGNKGTQISLIDATK